MSRLSNAVSSLKQNVRDSAAAARAPGYRSWNNFTPDERRQLEQRAAREEQARQWDIRQAKRAIAEEIDNLKGTFQAEERHISTSVKPAVDRAKAEFSAADRAWTRAKEVHKATERKFRDAEQAYNRGKNTPNGPVLKQAMDTLRRHRDTARTKADQAKGPRDRADRTRNSAEKVLREAEKKKKNARSAWKAAEKYK